MTFTANTEIAAFVPSVAPVAAFYADTLGFELVSCNDDMAQLDAGALTLYVVRADVQQGFTPSFDVEDASVARLRLQQAGCEPLGDGDGGGHFRDPFGLVFDVIERSRATA